MLRMMLWAAEHAVAEGFPIPSINPESIGIVGLVVVFAILLATNRIYTRGQVTSITAAHDREVVELKESHSREIERMEKSHDRELADVGHDRDEWRAAHRISETGRVEERDHNIEFVRDVAAPLRAFLEGVRRTARKEVTDE